jgi:hypothetical protein
MPYQKRLLPIGKKYNKLEIIEEVLTEENRRYVYCLCECGSKKVIRYDQLKSGKIKSCGCLLSIKNEAQIEKMIKTRRRNKDKVIAEEYIGKKFDRLTVKEIYHHPKYKGTWFVLNCDCGNEVKSSLVRLKIKHIRSCGCIRRKNEQIFISEIDGEKISVSYGKFKYCRIIKTKELLHLHEAKKLFMLKNKEWSEKLVVHHVDGNKLNNKLDNLAIISNNGEHHKHHARMERSMYSFLQENGLLDRFYNKYPNLKLTTLADLKHLATYDSLEPVSFLYCVTRPNYFA